jgi:4-amino-4-deoxy-L-arabinose transferase-like glycosyltransferase
MVRRAVTRVPVPLAILLAIATVLTTTWTVLSPPFQGPDENSHFAYVQLLAEEGTQPARDGVGHAVSTEVQNAIGITGAWPLMGNPAARPNWNKDEQADWRDRSFSTQQRSDGVGPNGQSQNPPLYYWLEVPPYAVGSAAGADVFDRLRLVRLWNVVFVLGGLVAVWLLTAEVFGTRRPWLPTVATGAVALHPKLTALAGNVNVESLLFLCFSVAMLAAVRMVRRGPTPAWSALLAAATVGGALTQGRGFGIAPAAVLALGLALWLHRPHLRSALKAVAPFAAIAIAGTVVLYLVTSSSGGPAFGAEAARTANAPLTLGGFLEHLWQFYLPPLPGMEQLGPAYGYRQVYIETFFSGLFHYEVSFGEDINDLLQLAVAGGVIGLVAAAVVKRARIRRAWPLALALAGFLVAEIGLVHLNSYKNLVVSGSPIITGRYLVPLLALFGVAVAFVVGALPRRVGAVAAGVALGTGVILNLALVGMTLTRFYV